MISSVCTAFSDDPTLGWIASVCTANSVFGTASVYAALSDDLTLGYIASVWIANSSVFGGDAVWTEPSTYKGIIIGCVSI